MAFESIIEARKALLDVLDALGKHRESAVLIGAQALYIHTGGFISPVAPFTQDADLPNSRIMEDAQQEVPKELKGVSSITLSIQLARTTHSMCALLRSQSRARLQF